MKLSKIIQRQIPAFIKENSAIAGERYNKFVSFLVRYYEFLETTFVKIGNVSGSSNKNTPTDINTPINFKPGQYYLVENSGHFSIGQQNNKVVQYIDKDNIIVFSDNGTSYVRNKESFNFLYDKDLSSNSQLGVILNALSNELAYNLPRSIVEEQFILQRIKELYTVKGSEEAFRFLFRILFNKEIEIFYPSSSILRTSDGQWRQDYSIFVRSLVGDPFKSIEDKIDILSIKNRVTLNVNDVKIREDASIDGAFSSYDLGYVRDIVESAVDLGLTKEEVDRLIDFGYTDTVFTDSLFEFFVDATSYNKFKKGDVVIYKRSGDNIFIGYVVATTTEAKVHSGGTGFRVGDLISTNTSEASGSILKVSEIGSSGSISKVGFLRFGFEYTRPFTIAAYKDGTTQTIIEEKSTIVNDDEFVTQCTFQDFTGGYVSRGYSLIDFDYALDEYSIINTQVIDQGQDYTSATILFTESPNGVTAEGEVIIDQGKVTHINIINMGSGYFDRVIVTGKISSNIGSNQITGSNTAFIEQMKVGDTIYTIRGFLGKVASIESDTQLTLEHGANRKHINVNSFLVRPMEVTATILGNGYGANVVCYIGNTLFWDLGYCGEVVSNFITNRIVSIPNELDRAIIRLYPGAVAKYPGYYSSNLGFLSDNIYLYDGKYYQDFSYVIKSDVGMNSYESYIRTTSHPAGTALFGEYQIYNDISVQSDLNIQNQFNRTFILNLVDYYNVFDSSEFIDVPEYEIKNITDTLSIIDYGNIVNDPYSTPYTEYSDRMWDDYTVGDVLITFE